MSGFMFKPHEFAKKSEFQSRPCKDGMLKEDFQPKKHCRGIVIYTEDD